MDEMKKLIVGSEEFEIVDNKARNDITLLKKYVTPEMFGAIGDGVVDDTSALQDAIEYGFSHEQVIYLTKRYLVTNTITIKGVRVTATAKGTQLIGNGHARIVAGDTITSIIEFIPATETTAYGITIKDLYLDGNNKATNGIYSSYPVSECVFENITISQCTNGVYINSNCYLNHFRAIRAYHCTEYGILFRNGNNTSNVFDKCYVDSCANAYVINGQYSTMISCCADAISNIVFNLASFTGSLISCGSEAKSFTTMFKIDSNSKVNILGGMYFGNPNLTGYYINVAAGSTLNIYSAVLNYMTQSESTGALYTIAGQAKLFIRDSSISKPFTGENYKSNTAVAFISTAVQTLQTTVTVDSNGVAELSLNPRNYSILSVTTSRTGWMIIPFASTSTKFSIKVCAASNFTPTISDKSFPITVTYISHSHI